MLVSDFYEKRNVNSTVGLDKSPFISETTAESFSATTKSTSATAESSTSTNTKPSSSKNG